MKKQAAENVGVIRPDELYCKQEFLRRVQASQPTWSKMLRDGVPYTEMGHQRWVHGKDVIAYFVRQAKRKSEKHDTETKE